MFVKIVFFLNERYGQGLGLNFVYLSKQLKWEKSANQWKYGRYFTNENRTPDTPCTQVEEVLKLAS
jgi:hypothetical protein